MTEYDMAEDMMRSTWFRTRVQDDRIYAQNLYAAMCNMRWQKVDVYDILKDNYWSTTWRGAGGIVAELQGKGDYMSWYCSGIRGSYDYHEKPTDGYVSEGTVTDEIREDLLVLGWRPSEWPDKE